MRHILPHVAILSAAVFLFPLGTAAQSSWRVTGEVGAELRVFVEDSRFDGQFGHIQPSAFAELDIKLQSKDRRHQISVTPFARVDGQDDRRTQVDLREAYYSYTGDNWDVLIGVNRVFWGVTESRHLVNVINQIDAAQNIDEEDFLGQPMLNIGTQKEFGRFDLYVMTGFRERTFPGVDGRLRTPRPVDEDNIRFQRSGEEWAPDVAVRYSHFFGNVDVGLHAFHGTGREPILSVSETGESLVQTYVETTQGGLDLQYTSGATLWKFEGLVRDGQGDTFPALVAGVEHTLFQFAGGTADLGLLIEYLYDDRDPIEAPPTIFNNDIFAGARYAINDAQDTALLAGVFVDLDDDTTAIRAEFERRIGQTLKFEAEIQIFASTDRENFADPFRDDSFLTLRLSRFF